MVAGLSFRSVNSQGGRKKRKLRLLKPCFGRLRGILQHTEVAQCELYGLSGQRSPLPGAARQGGYRRLTAWLTGWFLDYVSQVLELTAMQAKVIIPLDQNQVVRIVIFVIAVDMVDLEAIGDALAQPLFGAVGVFTEPRPVGAPQ
jgi:hypothetical protein